MTWLWRIVLVGLAVAAALAPIPPALVERYYSSAAYPQLQRAITTFSNRVPFALLDVLIALVLIVFAAMTARDVRRASGHWVATGARVAIRIATLAAALYLLFLVTWGWNYRRVPLTGKFAYDPAAISPAHARQLAEESVARVNRLYGPAHAELDAQPDSAPRLPPAFERAERSLRLAPAVPGRPKTSMLNWYFRRAGVAGMTDPYFLETLVATDLLPFERPFVIAHEWAHLAGLADESEANLGGWLTCVQGSPAQQYSGWLFLYSEVAASLAEPARSEVAGALGTGPRADLAAIRERLRRELNRRVSTAGWRVYDQYLKANRVEAGAASYAEVVQLVLGIRFSPDWVPTPAPPP
jgi:hypothetical protein